MLLGADLGGLTWQHQVRECAGEEAEFSLIAGGGQELLGSCCRTAPQRDQTCRKLAARGRAHFRR